MLYQVVILISDEGKEVFTLPGHYFVVVVAVGDVWQSKVGDGRDKIGRGLVGG